MITWPRHPRTQRPDELVLFEAGRGQYSLKRDTESAGYVTLAVKTSDISLPLPEADAEDVEDPNRCTFVIQFSTSITPFADHVTLSIPRALRNTLSFKSSHLDVQNQDLTVVPSLSFNDQFENKGIFTQTDTLSLDWAGVLVDADSYLVVESHSLEVDYELHQEYSQILARGRCEGSKVTSGTRGR